MKAYCSLSFIKDLIFICNVLILYEQIIASELHFQFFIILVHDQNILRKFSLKLVFLNFEQNIFKIHVKECIFY